MHDLDLIAPFAAAIILYFIAPLLSRLVLLVISAVIAKGRNQTADVKDQQIPYYLTPDFVSDYVEYAMRVIHRFDSLRVIYISGRRACMKDGLFLEMIGLPHANQRNRPSPCIIPRASAVTS